MNNKEFLEKVSQKTNYGNADVKAFSEALVGLIVGEVADGNVINIQGFGNLEPRVKARRKIYNPTTKTFNIVPQKTTMSYKMSATFKERLNID